MNKQSDNNKKNGSVSSNGISFDGIGEALSHIVDDESGEVIHIDKEMIQQLQASEGWLVIADLIKWIQYAIIQDNKLYSVRGCSSMKEYVNLYTYESYSNISKMASVGRLFKGAFGGKISPVKFLNGEKMTIEFPKNINENAKKINEIGIRKMYGISRLPDIDFSEVMDKGVISLNDGREINLKDLKKASSREVDKMVSEARKKDREAISNIEEKFKKSESEKEDYKTQLQQEKAENERLKHYEKFSKIAVSVDQLYEGIDKTISYMRQAQKAFGPLDTLNMKNDQVPPGLKEEIMNLVRLLNSMQTTAYNRFPFMREEMGEVGVLPTWLLKDPEEFGKLPEESDSLSDGKDDAVSAVQEIRTDTQRMAIKYKSNGPRSHGWSNLENGFETEDQMQDRYAELLASGQYVEG